MDEKINKINERNTIRIHDSTPHAPLTSIIVSGPIPPITVKGEVIPESFSGNTASSRIISELRD
jgi:hypothetical protein